MQTATVNYDLKLNLLLVVKIAINHADCIICVLLLGEARIKELKKQIVQLQKLQFVIAIMC